MERSMKPSSVRRISPCDEYSKVSLQTGESDKLFTITQSSFVCLTCSRSRTSDAAYMWLASPTSYLSFEYTIYLNQEHQSDPKHGLR